MPLKGKKRKNGGLKEELLTFGHSGWWLVDAVFIQSAYCGWQKNKRRKKRISEPDRGEKIACSVVDVIGEGSDAFPPG